MQFGQLNRREFITLLGGTVACPLAARAQQKAMRRIGVLTNLAEHDPEERRRVATFTGALQKLGWENGRDVQVDYRRTGGDAERTRQYAAELVALAPDAILAVGAAAM